MTARSALRCAMTAWADAGQAGLVVVAVADMGAKIERAMKRAARVQQKQLEADIAELERDAASVEAKLY
jgi:hypothetical protein